MPLKDDPQVFETEGEMMGEVTRHLNCTGHQIGPMTSYPDDGGWTVGFVCNNCHLSWEVDSMNLAVNSYLRRVRGREELTNSLNKLGQHAARLLLPPRHLRVLEKDVTE